MAPSTRPLVAHQPTRIERREDDEHVVLANCRSTARILSSQMAYFNGSIGPNPQDIAVVRTGFNQQAIWFGQTTEALFTASGTTFTATLNAIGADGDYIGDGENGYGPFFCYQRFYQDRYVYNDLVCNMVVDCSHATPTATPSPAPSNSAAASPGLATEAIIGISVGAGGACILLALVCGYFLWRYYRNKLTAPTEDGQVDGEAGEAPPISPLHDVPIRKEPTQVYELQGSCGATEMTNDNMRSEIDGISRIEMELEHERFSFAEGEDHAAKKPPEKAVR
ncbi:interleukin 15 receptor alpha [Microdochium nivale]|nr:interleukin 15 receptor alpha [Microdochium nivale]